MFKKLFNLLVFLVSGVAFFALASTASWFWLKSHEKTEPDTPPTAATAAAPSSTAVETALDGRPSAEMPVPVRGRPASAEEMFRYSATIRHRQEILKKREQALQAESTRLKLVQDDIQEEQRVLDGLLVQIHDSLAAGEKLLTRIAREREQLKTEKAQAEVELEQIKQAQTEYQDGQIDNVKKISRWFESMPSDKAADYLRELSNDGKIESAVLLLGNIEERDAAEILAALDDPGLVIQLTEKFKGLKRPPSKKRR